MISRETLFFAWGFFLALGLSIFFFAANLPPKLLTEVEMEEDVFDCKRKTLPKTASCVMNHLRSFHKYNISNVGKKLTFEELKEEGGVCSHYSNYYEMVGREFGYRTEKLSFMTSPTTAHMFTVWSDEEGYCILDQTSKFCVIFS